MTHRDDAEANLAAVQNTLAEIQGVPTTADVSIANATRAQAILALNDTLTQQEHRP